MKALDELRLRSHHFSPGASEALDRGDIEEGDRIIKRYVEMLVDANDNPELTLHEILGRNIERHTTRH